MNETEILSNLVKIDSVTGKPNKKIVEYIKSVIKNSLAQITVQKVPESGYYNLVVKFKGKNSINPLLFVGHTDTVPYSNNWKITNPLEPKLIENKLYGLGTNDMKGPLSSMIIAINNINEIPNNDIYFIFSADEESTSIGSKFFIKNSELKNCNIIICEPSNNTLINSQYSMVKIKITCYGKSMHTQFADFKTNIKYNAIFKAVEIINNLNKYQKQELEKTNNKFSVSTIKGGIKDNILPDKCSFIISLRLNPKLEIIKEIAKLKTVVGKDAKFKVIYEEQGFNLDKDNTFLNNIKNCFFKLNKAYPKITTKLAWTEAGLYKKIGNTLILGPGYSHNSHINDEYIKIDQIINYSKLYNRIIGEYNEVME